MNHTEIKDARKKLGLTLTQMAKMLDTDGRTMRRFEASPEKSTSRVPSVRVVRLLNAYLNGYRPDDWPSK